MMDPVIKVEQLNKNYGERRILKNLNMTVPRGSVYGFVGANGAGKTTTIRILLGLAAADSGAIQVLGKGRGTLPARPIPGLAYLPDVPDLSPWLTAEQALLMMAGFSGVPQDIAADRAKDLLSAVGLKGAPGRIGSFSRGMKQRLGIAATLIGAPELIIMDEPTSALDPLGRADVLEIIRSLAGEATVVFSSHILSDVQQVSTHIGMLHQGEMLAEGSIEKLLGAAHTLNIRTDPQRIEQLKEIIRRADPHAEIREELTGLDALFRRLTSREG